MHLFRSDTALSDLETGTKFNAEPSAFLGNKQEGVWSGKVPSEHKGEEKIVWHSSTRSYERLLKIIQRLFLLVAAREMNAKQMTLNIMCKYCLYILIFLEKFGVV